MADEISIEQIRHRFRQFARTVEHLPLYHRLAEGILDDPHVPGLLLAAQPGQARPVLLFAAVHDLLLAHPDIPAARWYPSITAPAQLPGGDPFPAFRQACLDHADELRHVIATHTTQTNEVNRCVLLAPLVAAAAADVPDQPLALIELGCSAGLLLGFDRYRIEVGADVVGDAGSSVRLAGKVVGDQVPATAPFPPSPAVTARVGLDLDPVELTDADRLRWLEACLWPDQPHRVERFRAAVDVMRDAPPRLVRGDFIEALPDVVAALPSQAHLVVFHVWALTYVARDRRPDLAATLAEVAVGGRPVSWLSGEAPNVVPGIVVPELPDGFEETQPETVLGLRRWRDGRELPPEAVGWGHPHGEWLTWTRSP